jgi:RHS repeat-associated protein
VGHVERLELGNDVWAEHAYDDRLRPTSITHNLMTEDPPGTWTVDEVVDARTLQWDAVHNKTQRADVRTGGPERVFDYAYDGLSRLTTATLTQSGTDTVEWDYTLNDVGSRSNIQKTVESDPPVVTNHSFTSDANTHAYSATPDWTSREYDDNGSLLLLDENLGTEVSFKYNHLDQMTERTDSSGTADYVYDALGRRIARTVSSVTTRYLYFGDRVVEERDDSAVPGTFVTTATYVYGLYVDEVLQMERGANAYYYHTDDQFNVTALTDATGAVVERYDYGDFGEPEFYNAGGTAISGTAYGNPYLFTGRRWDPESELYYYRSRYYDPAIGQFTTRDPIGVWGDTLNTGNGYAYVGNNPWTLVDPLGLEGGFFEGFADMFGFGGLRDMRSRKERMVDAISFGEIAPGNNSALLLAGMADFGGKICKALPGPLSPKAELALEAWSMIPVLGIPADILLVANDLRNGDYIFAALGVLAMFPVAGDIYAGGTRFAMRHGGDARAGVKAFWRTSDEVAGFVSRKMDDMGAALRRLFGTGGCFVAGTLIWAGEGAVPIEDIAIGDQVWAYNETTGEVGLYEVVRKFERLVPGLVELQIAPETENDSTAFEDAETVLTTKEHPFWVEGAGWIDAGALKPGDTLKTLDGTRVTVAAVRVVFEETTVYNIKVAEAHSYFVSDARVLVHNNNACAAPPGWRVGDPITNLTRQGNVPQWDTVRQRHWKNRANGAGLEDFAEENLDRMRRGRAPQRKSPRTGRIESKELHHTPPRRDGGLFDFEEVWPGEHAAVDPFRRTGD